jgi:hypothetical protein
MQEVAMPTAKKSRNQRRNENRKKYRIPGYQEGGSVASSEPPDAVALIIIDEFSKRGLDGQFAAKVAQNESGLNPNAVGDGGHSHGIFQLYDQGLLSDFYAQGYTDPYDARQSASYTADKIAATHDWGPWHGARALYAAGTKPSDGASYNDGQYSYPGGGGQPGSHNAPGAYPALPDTGNSTYDPNNPNHWSRDEWAYVVAMEMGSQRPPGLTDDEWKYIVYAEADRRRNEYMASHGAIPGGGTTPGSGAPPGGGAVSDPGGPPVGSPSNPATSVSSSTSSSSSYNVSETGPVAADIDRERNRISADANRITEELGKAQAEIDKIRAYGDISAQNRLRGLEEQKFQYQQDLDKLDYELNLLELAINMREQDISLRGQDISMVMAQLDAAMQGRGQDVTMRGQDFDAQIQGINAQIAFWSEQRQAARDRNDATAMRDAEARMRAEMENRNILTQREQDIALRSQDIDAALGYGQLINDQWKEAVSFAKYTGDFALQKHAEERLHQASQQSAALETFGKQLDANRQKLDAATSETEAYSALAAQEQDWNKFLSEKLANPRDFPQYFAAMGKGEQWLDSLLSGKPFAGQTIGNAGEIPLVSSPYREQAQPDRTAWNAAMASAGKIWDRGGQVPTAPTIEEILAIGNVSPIGDAPEMPEAPNLPNPTTLARPGALDFAEPPPMSDVVDAPTGPGTFTKEMATKEVQDKLIAWQAANPGKMPPGALLQQWNHEAMAKVGTTDWNHFTVTDTSPVSDVNPTDFEAPPAPGSVQGDELWTREEVDAEVRKEIDAWIAANPGQPVVAAQQDIIAKWAPKIGTPKPKNGYMPTVSPFPENVPSTPPASALPPPVDPTDPGPTIGTPPGGSTVSPPPTTGGGSPPPTGGGTYHPPVNPTPQPTQPPPRTTPGSSTDGRAEDWLADRGIDLPVGLPGRGQAPRRHAMGGHEQIIDEPTTAYGDLTGRPKFTLAERTPGFPNGIPERVEVSPDGMSADIQPFGQQPGSAATNIIQDTLQKLRAAQSYDEKRSVVMEMMQAIRPVMGISEEEGQGQDLWRIQHGGASPKEAAYMNAAAPPAPAGGDVVSPPGSGMPPAAPAGNLPAVVSSLLAGEQSVPRAARKLRRTARQIGRR